MAKLPSIEFKHTNETGEIMEFRASVTIDLDGTFNVSIPDELEQSVRAMRLEDLQVHITKPAQSTCHRVSGKRLDDCREFIKAVMEDYLKCEVTTERVICYGHSIKVSCAKDELGGHHPNGYLAQEAVGKKHAGNGEGYAWFGELGINNNSSLFSVGLGAKVFDKLTYHRASGVKVVYKRPDYPHREYNNPGQLLNSFIGLDFSPKHSKQMPYSDEAALFFYDAMIAMCKLADKVESFLGDKKNLMLAIESRMGLLPAPGPHIPV